MWIAEKTLEAIATTMYADQGARFRVLEGELLPKMEDAYRPDSSPYRKHLGISLIGRECARELWYGFRWAKAKKFDARQLRLFNRGHLEEARFLAMLLMIGCEVWYETEDGGQYRVSDIGGHFGSALDGIARGIPDLSPEAAAYTEFKTSNTKGFKKLKEKGVQEAKPEHFKQMQCCMHKYNLPYGLYMSVCKETDEVHAEIIEYNPAIWEWAYARASDIIFTSEPPQRVGKSRAFFKCKFCDYAELCHTNEMVPDINCRTCVHSTALPDGTWQCAGGFDTPNTEQAQYGCPHHVMNPNLIKGAEMLDGNQAENWMVLKLPSGGTAKVGTGYMTSKDLCELILPQ